MRYALCVLIACCAVSFAAEEKPPVPDKAAVADAEKQIRDILKDEYAGLAAKPPDAKKALAEKLLQQGVESKTNVALCYASLKEAIALSVQTGDAQTALKAADELEKTFQGDAMPLKLDALSKIGAALTSADAAKELARQCLSLIDQLAAADNYDAAVKLGVNTSAIARKTQDQSLMTQVQQKGLELQRLQVEFAKLKTVEKTLAEKPDDPAANLAKGRFVCFVKNDWNKGLPLLAKGNDMALNVLAAQESAPAGSNDALLQLADGWWDAAKKEQGGAGPIIRTHAAEIYARILPQLAPLQATKVETRLEEMGTFDAVERDFGSSKEGELLREASSYEIVMKHGKRCIAFSAPAVRFTVSDYWAQKWATRNKLEVEIEYLYEGAGALDIGVDYKPSKDWVGTKSERLSRGTVSKWQVARFAMPGIAMLKTAKDAPASPDNFEGYNFRLLCWKAKDLCISRVVLRRLKGTSPTGGK